MSGLVLVTGANGYVGGWCIVRLLQQGYQVRATIRDLGRTDDIRRAISAQAPTDNLSFVTADLLNDAGWSKAMEGVDYVLHVASPLGGGEAQSDREALVAPARDGTLRVLKAATEAGVKRVVMTSAAATARPPLTSQQVSNETLWADAEDPQFDAYRVSKIRAEKAAWEFMNASDSATEFTTILPGAVFGPILTPGNLGSVKIVEDLANGRPPVMPRLGFWVVDVRDLVDAHIRAMQLPEAAGERFIVAGRFLWMADMALILRQKLGVKAPTRVMPDWLVRLLVPFLANLRPLAPLIGRRFEIDTSKAQRMLGFNPRPTEETLVDCVQSLKKG